MLNMLKPGDVAPAFALYNSEKQLIKLSEFSDKNVVLLFFPFAFSGVCTKEMCAVQNDYAQWQSRHAEVMGISVDSLYTNAQFKQVYNLKFQLLSDFNKEVSQAYGVLAESFGYGYRGVSKRAVFIINRKGILEMVNILPSPGDMPDLFEISRVLETLA